MKENIYDQPEFFAAYSQMDRSRRGLEAAGEWETLAAMLPDCAGLDVLDLGCGYGWHCRYAAEHGARSVLGTDLSARMLAEARRRTNPSAITYRRAAMEDLECPDAAFDLVFSSLALHYVRTMKLWSEKFAAGCGPGAALSFRRSTRYSPPRGRRTGSTTLRGASAISRWTAILRRAGAPPAFWVAA